MAARLVSARWVCPIVAPPIEEGALVLGGPGGDTIVACGRRVELRREFPAIEEERAVGALLPGLVNAHTHLELSAYAAAGPIEGGAGLIPWTRALLAARAARRAPTETHVPAGEGDSPGGATVPCEVFAAARAAAESARAFGTAALGDVGNGPLGWRALNALGFRGLFFHELVGSREAATGDALADAARERARERGSAHAPLPPGTASRSSPDPVAVLARDDRTFSDDDAYDVPAVPAAHAPYSVGPALLRRIFAAAAHSGHPTSIHLAEDVAELELLRHGRGAWPSILTAMGVPEGERVPGLGPTAYLDGLGAFATAWPPLLVHMVHADDDDLRRARAAKATLVVCPRSNLHLANRLPDVPAMLAAGVRLALGTDSLASAPDLSLWQELATLARHFPAVPARVWLDAATRGGARGLGLAGDDGAATPPGRSRAAASLGMLRPGARPGVLDVSLDATSLASSSAVVVERALVSRATPPLTWICPA